MNDLYQRVQIKSEEADSAEILGVLPAIQEGEPPNDLKLPNYFKEIPASFGATILTVEKCSAELEVHQLQAVVMASEKVTALKSAYLARDMLANATYVNVDKSRIVLSKFSYALLRADCRMSVRVELTTSLYATFTSPCIEFSGRLNDISLTGVSLFLAEVPRVPSREQGTLTIPLPEASIMVPATLLKVLEQENGFRLAFQIEPLASAEALISQYILKMQVEIIRELKDHPGLNLP